MPKSYTMRGVQQTADRGVELAEAALRWLSPDGTLHDVQADPRFQHRGVDLLWERPGMSIWGVEVKGDRHARGGNYFLELVSNLEKNTPGCFLYTEADLLAYVFVDVREVHLLPVSAARHWFLERSSEFPLRHTRTRMGPHHYTTVGALVPFRRLLADVAGAERWTVNASGEAEPKGPARGRRSA